MLIKADTANAAIPYEEFMVHDQWLAIYSSSVATKAHEPRKTVRYRQHKGNQTGVLTGVLTKNDYFRLRIERLRNRKNSLKLWFRGNADVLNAIEKVRKWAIDRKGYCFRPTKMNLKRFMDREAQRCFDDYI